jgi:hypothetical protein
MYLYDRWEFWGCQITRQNFLLCLEFIILRCSVNTYQLWGNTSDLNIVEKHSFHANGAKCFVVVNSVDTEFFLALRADICVTPVSHTDTLPCSISRGKALACVSRRSVEGANGVNSIWVCCCGLDWSYRCLYMPIITWHGFITNTTFRCN